MHDEKTTELELPGTIGSNVVRLPTAKTSNESHKATAHAVPLQRANRSSWLKELDLGAPWVLRLVAVITILILSMLVL